MPELTTRQQQRLNALAKARLTKASHVSTPKAITDLKTAYLDDDNWVELAKVHGISLPRKSTPCTGAKVAPYLTKLGITRKQFTAWCGYANPTEWIEKNPTWSLRAFVGLLLEELDDPRGSVCFGKQGI